MALKSIIPGTITRPKQEMKQISELRALKDAISHNLDFTTTILIGGLIQGTLLLLVPRLWVLLPTLIVLVARFANTLAVTFELIPNPQMKDALLYRTTAVLPNTEGEFNKEGTASNEKIAVLVLGLRINHPLGFIAPQVVKLNSFFDKMNKALDDEAPDNGFLGQTQWTNKATNGSQDIMVLSYWRSVEDVHRFSVGPTHRETWAWWEKYAPELKHIGISHEVFQADKAMYENVYINFQPTRMGAMSFLRKGDEEIGGTVPDTWINPLVDASRGKLRTSKGRLGWVENEKTEEITEKQSLY